MTSKIIVLNYEATVGQGEAHIGLVVCCQSSVFALQRWKIYVLFGFVQEIPCLLLGIKVFPLFHYSV